MIEGVVLKDLNVLSDERGKVMRMLRCDDEHFEKFGEIYFSIVYPGKVKGWHLHKRMIQHYAVPEGMIKLVLYDDRQDSPTKGKLTELFVGENNYILVKIPPGVWNGFRGEGDKPALIANCATIPHDAEEIVRLDPWSKKIPYDWDKD